MGVEVPIRCIRDVTESLNSWQYWPLEWAPNSMRFLPKYRGKYKIPITSKKSILLSYVYRSHLIIIWSQWIRENILMIMIVTAIDNKFLNMDLFIYSFRMHVYITVLHISNPVKFILFFFYTIILEEHSNRVTFIHFLYY